jgi:hypothetical protein
MTGIYNPSYSAGRGNRISFQAKSGKVKETPSQKQNTNKRTSSNGSKLEREGGREGEGNISEPQIEGYSPLPFPPSSKVSRP